MTEPLTEHGMEDTTTTASRAELLADPEGQPLGRIVAPRPGPVIGRASGTVYLGRPARRPARPLGSSLDCGYVGER